MSCLEVHFECPPLWGNNYSWVLQFGNLSTSYIIIFTQRMVHLWLLSVQVSNKHHHRSLKRCTEAWESALLWVEDGDCQYLPMPGTRTDLALLFCLNFSCCGNTGNRGMFYMLSETWVKVSLRDTHTYNHRHKWPHRDITTGQTTNGAAEAQ